MKQKLYKRVAKNIYTYWLFPNEKPFNEIIQEHGDYNTDWYESIYRYNETHYNHFIEGVKEVCSDLNINYDQSKPFDTISDVFIKISEIKKEQGKKVSDKIKRKFSVKGSHGIKTNRIVLDFDEHHNYGIEQARLDTLTCYQNLIEAQIPKDSILCCFSGNKGFSLETRLNEFMTKREFESVVDHLGANLKTFDPIIKDHQRVFRIPMTKHQTSGLYKIPIEHDLLSQDVNTIKQKAEYAFEGETPYKLMDMVFDFNDKKIKTPPMIKKYQTMSVEEKKELELNIDGNSGIDFEEKPHWLTKEEYALQQGLFGPGIRDKSLYMLCAIYRNNGFPEPVAYGMLKGVAELQAKRYGVEPFSEDEIQSNIMDQIYTEGWIKRTFTKNHEVLKRVRKELKEQGYDVDDETKVLLSIKQVEERFKKYTTEFTKNKVQLGIDELDEKIVIVPGMMVGILASAGAGKTTLMKCFMKYASRHKIDTLFECLDMTDPFMYARMLQEYNDLSFDEICTTMEKNNDDDLDGAFSNTENDYENVTFQFNSGTSCEDIRNHMYLHKQLKGDYPKVVFVDYLDKVAGPYTDETANSNYVSAKLSDLAREFNCVVFLLLQPQKITGDASSPILSYRRIKGHSNIENSCRVILAMWRLFAGMEDDGLVDNYATVAILKQNLGTFGKVNLFFDPKRGIFRSMNNQEKETFEQQMSKLEEQSEDGDMNAGWAYNKKPKTNFKFKRNRENGDI